MFELFTLSGFCPATSYVKEYLEIAVSRLTDYDYYRYHLFDCGSFKIMVVSWCCGENLVNISHNTKQKRTNINSLDEKLNLMIFASKTNLRQIWCQICPAIKCPKCETNLLSHLSWGNVRQMWFKYAIIFALVQRYLKTRQIREK